MHIDIQFSAEGMRRGLLARLRGTPLIVPTTFPLLGEECVVDTVDIEEVVVSRGDAVEHPVQTTAGRLGTVSGPSVLAEVETSVRIVTVEALREGGLAGAAEAKTVAQLQLTFRLTADFSLDDAGNGSVALGFTYAGKNATLPDPEADAMVEERLAGLNRSNAISLQAIEQMLGGDAPLRNAGMSISDDGDVCLRLEVGDVRPGAADRWRSFYGGTWARRLRDREWAVFLSSSLIVAASRQQLRQRVRDTDELEVGETPETAWRLVDPGADGYQPFGVVAWWGGNLIDVCPPFDLDVWADITVSTGMRLGELHGAPALVTRFRATWNLTDSDVLACALTGGVFGGIIGLLGGIPGVVIGFTTGAVAATAIGGVFGDEYEVENDELGFQLEANCEFLESDRSESVEGACWQAIDMPGGELLGGLEPSHVYTDSAGLTIGGAIPEPAARGGLAVSTTPPVYSTHKSCSTNSMQVEAIDAQVLAHATASAYRIAMTPLIREDPLNVFTIKDASNSSPWLALASFGWGGPGMVEYVEAPYPLQVLALTSHGARWVVPGSVPAYPDTTLSERQLLGLIAECNALSHQFWEGGRFNPKWHVDPPPDFVEELHHWEVVITGLAPEQVLDVVARERTQVVANERGAVRVEVVAEPGGNEFSMSGGKAGRGDPVIAILQRALSLQQSFDLPAGATALRISQLDGAPVALVDGRRATFAYALDGSRRLPVATLPRGSAARETQEPSRRRDPGPARPARTDAWLRRASPEARYVRMDVRKGTLEVYRVRARALV